MLRIFNIFLFLPPPFSSAPQSITLFLAPLVQKTILSPCTAACQPLFTVAVLVPRFGPTQMSLMMHSTCPNAANFQQFFLETFLTAPHTIIPWAKNSGTHGPKFFSCCSAAHCHFFAAMPENPAEPRRHFDHSREENFYPKPFFS